MFSKKFGQIFSKSTPKMDVKSNDEILNASEIEQLIKDSLTHYKSDIFPQGVFVVCQQFSMSQKE